MKNIIDIKEFTYFLRINRNKIIDRWLGSVDVQNILHKHSIPIIDKNTQIFYEFCDCFISVSHWDNTISECKSKAQFLKLLYNYNVGTTELFLMIQNLKIAVEYLLYENHNLPFALQTQLEKIALYLCNELSANYNNLNLETISSKDEHSNLLNEYKKAVDLSNIVSKTNPKGIITYVNDKFCEISGYTKEELIGKPHNIIRHPSMSSDAFKDLWDTIKSKEPWNGIVTNMTKDGRKYIVDTTIIPILDVDGDIVEYIAVRHDITELEEAKEQLNNINKAMKHKVDELYSMTSILEQQATKDSLTDLYNRMKFEEIIAEYITIVKKKNNDLSMILFDIDNFKDINDKYGHQVGDSVLVELSSIIGQNIKTQDTLARWGGEEFVILLPGTNLEGAVKFAAKLRTLVENYKFDFVGHLTSSFGVGQFEMDETKTTFFEKVDKALYIAKHKGKNRVESALFSCVE